MQNHILYINKDWIQLKGFSNINNVAFFDFYRDRIVISPCTNGVAPNHYRVKLDENKICQDKKLLAILKGRCYTKETSFFQYDDKYYESL